MNMNSISDLREVSMGYENYNRALSSPAFPETKESFEQWVKCDSQNAKPLFGIYTHVMRSGYNRELPNWPRTQEPQIQRLNGNAEMRYENCNTGCIVIPNHDIKNADGKREVATLQTLSWSVAMGFRLTRGRRPDTCSTQRWATFRQMEDRVLRVTRPLIRTCPQIMEFMSSGDDQRTADIYAVTDKKHIVGQVLLRDQDQLENYRNMLENSISSRFLLIEKVRVRALCYFDITNNDSWYSRKRMSGTTTVNENGKRTRSDFENDVYALSSPYPMFTDYVELMGSRLDEMIWRAYHAGVAHQRKRFASLDRAIIDDQDVECPPRYNGSRVEFE